MQFVFPGHGRVMHRKIAKPRAGISEQRIFARTPVSFLHDNVNSRVNVESGLREDFQEELSSDEPPDLNNLHWNDMRLKIRRPCRLAAESSPSQPLLTDLTENSLRVVNQWSPLRR
jgi:hypothetical protein